MLMYGAEAQANVLLVCAEQLSAQVDESEEAPLTLKEASELGGYSEDHLGRLLREKKISNAGRKGAPRIRRADVPTKSGYVAPGASSPEVDREQIVRSVINEGVG